MFNSYSNSNHFSYNINAVSGTLRKSHPKSKFCVRKVDENNAIFDSKKPRLVWDQWAVEVVILQAMLTGENKILVEYVYKEDFEEEIDNG